LTTVLLFIVFYFSQNKNNQVISSQITHSPIKTQKNSYEKSHESNVVSLNQNSMPPANFVKTYQGSKPDGAIHLDDNGDVIIDKDLKRLFDYYLSAIGDLPLDQMRKYLLQLVGQELNANQLQQLLGYFDKYHNYLTKADKFSHSIGDNLSLQKKMKLFSEFRLNSLGIDMAKAFFADEQNYINFVMTEKVKDELVGQKQDWLEAENDATEFQDVVLENREFNKAENINSSEVDQYRVGKYGQEAADRLGQLDEQRAQWNTIVNEYFMQRKQVENQQSTFSLEQINSNYTPQEIRRLEALWRIENQSSL
jgi:lipase chaperone LimK